MDCVYRVAGENDLDLLVALRLDFIAELRPEYSADRLREIRAGADRYIRGCRENGTYVGFVGQVDAEVVCSAAILVYELPPLAGGAGRKVGHVMNFFTRREFRHRGYGFGLMERIKVYARDHGFFRLFLNATEDGYPLYSKCGFKDADKAMEYNF